MSRFFVYHIIPYILQVVDICAPALRVVIFPKKRDRLCIFPRTGGEKKITILGKTVVPVT